MHKRFTPSLPKASRVWYLLTQAAGSAAVASASASLTWAWLGGPYGGHHALAALCAASGVGAAFADYKAGVARRREALAREADLLRGRRRGGPVAIGLRRLDREQTVVDRPRSARQA